DLEQEALPVGGVHAEVLVPLPRQGGERPGQAEADVQDLPGGLVAEGGRHARQRIACQRVQALRHRPEEYLALLRTSSVERMEENGARRVVDALRERGIDAHMLRAGVDKFGVQVSLHDGRNAEWDTDGTIGLEAQVMQDGVLVGFVPKID